MTSRYYTTYSNLSTRIRVLGLPASASALVVLTEASGASTSYTSTREEDIVDVVVPPQVQQRYQLALYALLQGSVVPAITAILDVASGIPDATTAGIVVELAATETTVAVVDVTVALLQSGGSGDWQGGTVTLPIVADAVSISTSDEEGRVGIPGAASLSPDGSIISQHGGAQYRCLIQGNYLNIESGSGETTTMTNSEWSLAEVNAGSSTTVTSGRVQLSRSQGFTPIASDVVTLGELQQLLSRVGLNIVIPS